MSTIFAKIISGQASADIIYQDDQVTAFRDINPQAPTHILIVPNREIATFNDVTPSDEALLGHMMIVARQVAEQTGVAQQGYRLIVNCGSHAGQEIFHLHIHLLGGRPLGPMLTRRG